MFHQQPQYPVQRGLKVTVEAAFAGAEADGGKVEHAMVQLFQWKAFRLCQVQLAFRVQRLYHALTETRLPCPRISVVNGKWRGAGADGIGVFSPEGHEALQDGVVPA